jgi:hypothetical protein
MMRMEEGGREWSLLTHAKPCSFSKQNADMVWYHKRGGPLIPFFNSPQAETTACNYHSTWISTCPHVHCSNFYSLFFVLNKLRSNSLIIVASISPLFDAHGLTRKIWALITITLTIIIKEVIFSKHVIRMNEIVQKILNSLQRLQVNYVWRNLNDATYQFIREALYLSDHEQYFLEETPHVFPILLLLSIVFKRFIYKMCLF